MTEALLTMTAPGPRCHHAFADGADTAKRAGQGHVDDLRPLVVRHLEYRDRPAESRVVDHDVDGPIGFCEIQKRLDVLLDGHVAHRPANAVGSEFGAQRGRGRLQPSGMRVAHDDERGALLQEPANRRRADARSRGSGDDHTPPGHESMRRDVVGRCLLGSVLHGRGSFGRPSTRSAMMLRWISSDPP